MIERNRMIHYLERARLTRFKPLGKGFYKELMPSPDERARYKAALTAIFNERPAPKTFHRGDIFNLNDDTIKNEVFLAAYSHVKMDSTPGFPFNYLYQINEEVPMPLVKLEVEHMINGWLFEDVDELKSMSKKQMLTRGYSMPASVFIKGEFTKEEKIARLIYGLSLVMNVAARIIFGDYLNDIADTWETSTHKVGMDMYTDDGLKKLFNGFDRLRSHGCRGIVSDDIQGWEYMYREWMNTAWHSAYLQRANATDFHYDLQMCYMIAEQKAMVLDSEGYIHDPKMFFMYSGKPTTHLENSDSRGALAKVDSGSEFVPTPTANTNGDDCLSLPPISTPMFSERLGFVHTDVREQLPNKVNFCSQVIERHGDGTITRMPDGLAKTFCNSVVNQEIESRSGIALHIKHHRGAFSFKRLVALCDSFQQREYDKTQKQIHDNAASAAFNLGKQVYESLNELV